MRCSAATTSASWIRTLSKAPAQKTRGAFFVPENGGNMEQYKPKKHEWLKVKNTLCMQCAHQSCLMLGSSGCPALISFSESKEKQKHGGKTE
jgi:hypothetical protein